MSRRGESIYKRKDGRWEARYIHHYENGKAKYRYLYAKSYTEVRNKRLAEWQAPSKILLSTEKSSANFKELSISWLEHIRSRVKESTYTRYHRCVYAYIHPHLSNQMVCMLDEVQIRNITNQLKSSGGKGGAPLSAKTVSDILCIIKSIFKYGREHGYLCANLDQIKSVQVPKIGFGIITSKECTMIERMIMTSETNERDSRVKLGILFSLYTGVRIGELCGLTHRDIDLHNQTVTISRTVERITNLDEHASTKTKLIISAPKTGSSMRIIPLPSFLVDYLSTFAAKPDWYLLTGTTKYTEPHQFYLRYKTFMRKLNLERYTFHALRHTFATRCIDIGFDPKSLAEILGHAHVSTTLSLYVHPTLEQKRRQMERLKPDLIS